MEDNTTNNNANIPRNAGKQKKKKQDPNIKKSIKFLNTNAQSLQYKISELAAKLNHEEIQIAGITESWGQEWNEAILSIKGYQDYRKNRKDGRRGGGCILYVSEDLKSHPCRELQNMPGDDSVWCWIKPGKEARILVGCIYRSTSSTTENNELLMQKIVKACEVADQNRILLMGDYNVGEINWAENEVIGGPRSLSFIFNECIKVCFLYQHVMEPTRFRNQQESTLDLIFTKEEEDVKNIDIDFPLGRSDHATVKGEFVCEWKVNTVFTPKRLYHKADYDVINGLINEINWEVEFEGKNVHQKWTFFKNKLDEIVTQKVPMSEPRQYY